MQIKCEYCKVYFSDSEEKCPSCGAPNDNLKRTVDGQPRTMEELKEFAAAHGISLENLRVFVGIDYREPKAYGIYQDGQTGNYIVYKNKSNGSRSIRYSGKDEAYAVNELFQKVREEMNKNSFLGGRISYQPDMSALESNRKASKVNSMAGVVTIVILILIFSSGFFSMFRSLRGFDSGYSSDIGSSWWDSDDDYDGGGIWSTFSDSGSSWDNDWDSDWGSGWDSGFSSSGFDWDSDW